MKKLCISYVIFAILLIACDMRTSGLHATDAIDSIHVERYDRVQARYLTTGDYAALQEMNTNFPVETRALIEDILKLGPVSDININRKLLNFYQDSILQAVIYAAEADYADMSDIDEELRESFGRLKKEVPHVDIPTFYAQIGAFDQSIVVDDKNIGISLDKYLGDDFPAYKQYYDKSQLASMKREFIVPDCMVFYLISQFGKGNFDQLTQQDRDMEIGIMMWTANKLVGRKSFTSPYINKVEKYMDANPSVSIHRLLLDGLH